MNTIVNCISWLSRQLAVFSGAFTGVITVIICIDVMSRLILGQSVPGASEVSILLLTALIFLGLPGAEANGENFSVSIFRDRLNRKWQAVLSFVVTLLSLSVVALMAYFSWLRAIDSISRGESSYGVIPFPVWPGRLVVAIGLSILALQLVANIVLISRKESTSYD